MADVATPAAAPVDKTAVVKPERPDEEAYKTNLAKAEKELKAAEERMVCCRETLHSAPPNHAAVRMPHNGRLFRLAA